MLSHFDLFSDKINGLSPLPSPANVDASVMYRRWKESKGKDKEYENIIR